MASGPIRSDISSNIITHFAMHLEFSLTKRNDSLDFRVSPKEGIIDDSAEISLETKSSFFDELGVIVGFDPKMSDGEGRQLELK